MQNLKRRRDFELSPLACEWRVSPAPISYPEAVEEMEKRMETIFERSMTTTVNDIEHIESQSLPRYGIVKVFFQPGVNINGALAQTTAASQTVLKYLPPGITPPFVLSFNASSVPVVQLALSSKSLSQALLKTKVFPELATSMIEVGESTGALPQMLNSVAEFFEEDVQTALTAALSLIEPLILVVMGVVVVTIMIALYLPIFSLGQTGAMGGR